MVSYHIRGRNPLVFSSKTLQSLDFPSWKNKTPIFLLDWKVSVGYTLIKAAATPFAILFIVIRQFYWSSQGQPLKEISDVNLFHFAEEKGFMKNLGRIPPTCSFETCFESRHFTVFVLIGGQHCPVENPCERVKIIAIRVLRSFKFQRVKPSHITEP